MKIKKYNELINYSQDYDYEEEDENFDFSFICIYNINNVYLLEDIVDNDTVILYDKYRHHHIGLNNIIHYPTPEEIDEIYENKYAIYIYNRHNDRWNYIFWKDLPKKLKERIG